MKFYLTLSLLFLLSGCSSHWSYDGQSSPDHWAELSTDYGRCKSGKTQSPIDLKHSTSVTLKDSIKLNYQKSHAKVINNGHTIEFDLEDENTITYNGKKFKLLQFHFHADSEHTINGKHAPAELHLVHKSNDGQLAVIGVLINVIDRETDIDFFDRLPTTKEKLSKIVDLKKILPANMRKG